MKKISIGVLLGVLIVIGISSVAVRTGNSKSETAKDSVTTKEPVNRVGAYGIYGVKLPEDINFAGEQVPIEQPDIYERVDREFLVNTYWQSNAVLLMKRAEKYFPIIEPILKEEGIPEDFKYLAVAESGLQQVTSPAGAKGVWQIMKSTGKALGLEINRNVDERYNIKLATRAACKYLKKSKENFDSWTLAAAAYNAGNAGISRALSKQKVNSYYDLHLNSETGRYIFRIIALKEILSTPESFGFSIDSSLHYDTHKVKTIHVNDPIDDLVSFAKAYGISYKLLKIYNPWLLEDHLNNSSHKAYEIVIPVQK